MSLIYTYVVLNTPPHGDVNLFNTNYRFFLYNTNALSNSDFIKSLKISKHF